MDTKGENPNPSRPQVAARRARHHCRRHSAVTSHSSPDSERVGKFANAARGARQHPGTRIQLRPPGQCRRYPMPWPIRQARRPKGIHRRDRPKCYTCFHYYAGDCLFGCRCIWVEFCYQGRISSLHEQQHQAPDSFAQKGGPGGGVAQSHRRCRRRYLALENASSDTCRLVSAGIAAVGR